jgi:hypothetical protein
MEINVATIELFLYGQTDRRLNKTTLLGAQQESEHY